MEQKQIWRGAENQEKKKNKRTARFSRTGGEEKEKEGREN